eukprot:CAMPEP_0194276390 /NCGR_PEP_ID=MMETSP0169-20130528/9003_1 /TAXON_ID=218684 /ORGANISM="Corethron pennatum, Strain L29A3" /LENGTH=359 /DNA_ID=CAMNT_0039020103 /DNA_START=30 /DNA_END=1109 /DNA_ORIENTATION=-
MRPSGGAPPYTPDDSRISSPSPPTTPTFLLPIHTGRAGALERWRRPDRIPPPVPPRGGAALLSRGTAHSSAARGEREGAYDDDAGHPFHEGAYDDDAGRPFRTVSVPASFLAGYERRITELSERLRTLGAGAGGDGAAAVAPPGPSRPEDPPAPPPAATSAPRGPRDGGDRGVRDEHGDGCCASTDDSYDGGCDDDDGEYDDDWSGSFAALLVVPGACPSVRTGNVAGGYKLAAVSPSRGGAPSSSSSRGDGGAPFPKIEFREYERESSGGDDDVRTDVTSDADSDGGRPACGPSPDGTVGGSSGEVRRIEEKYLGAVMEMEREEPGSPTPTLALRSPTDQGRPVRHPPSRERGRGGAV